MSIVFDFRSVVYISLFVQLLMFVVIKKQLEIRVDAYFRLYEMEKVSVFESIGACSVWASFLLWNKPSNARATYRAVQRVMLLNPHASGIIRMAATFLTVYAQEPKLALMVLKNAVASPINKRDWRMYVHMAHIAQNYLNDENCAAYALQQVFAMTQKASSKSSYSDIPQYCKKWLARIYPTQNDSHVGLNSTSCAIKAPPTKKGPNGILSCSVPACIHNAIPIIEPQSEPTMRAVHQPIVPKKEPNMASNSMSPKPIPILPVIQ